MFTHRQDRKSQDSETRPARHSPDRREDVHVSKITVEVDVDARDVLPEVSREDLVRELKSRGVSVREALGVDEVEAFTARIKGAIRYGAATEALDLLADILHALTAEKQEAALRAKYEAAKKARDPITGRPVLQ